MIKCIVVKGKQFKHQMVFSGAGPEQHCIFCQMSYPSIEQYFQDAMDEEIWVKTIWPEGAEL